jgi:hypothetical protein
MPINNSRWRTAAALIAVSLAITACTDNLNAPAAPIPAAAGSANVALDISSLTAQPGERVALAIYADAGRAVGAVQGRLYFDASRLQYTGQTVEGTAMVLVNDTRANTGELRFTATDVNGFASRAATFVFEVRSRGYEAGLRFASEEIAAVNADILTATVLPGARLAADLATVDLASAHRIGVTDWAARLDDPRDHGKLIDVNLRPGEYKLNLVYGDANLSGGTSPITGSDALIVAQVAVGLREVIAGSGGSPSIDAVVAGNVAPFNNPGLGEAGDALPPGVNSDGTRTITGADVLVIRQKAVGLNPAVAGELIPGRGPLASARVSVPAGTHTVSETWTANNIYQLEGVVQFASGAVLTIEPGTRIEGVGLQTTGAVSALQIGRDATIQAIGTPLQPIVFTCAGVEPKPKGCWGGVWIAGNARVNEGDVSLGVSPANGARSAGGCNQRAGEATNPQVLFGGCNDDDNSGTLRYAVIEYAGWTFAPNVELNGLTLGAVGRGTTLDHIQVHAGQDDAVELFGGSVNIKYLYLTANSDDNFDISFGWSGSAQFIVMAQDPNDGDKGVEADNTETTATYGNTPRTNGQIWNVTFLGASTGAGTNASNDAIHVRRGTGPFISNWLVANARFGMDLDDAATCSGINAAGGLNVRNSLFAAVANLGNDDADPSPCGPYTSATELEEAIINDAANGNSVSASTASDLMISPMDRLLPDFRPKAGQATGGATPPSNGFFDVTATYVGAVAPANSTRGNIPWYSGWTRGWTNATTP